MADLKFLMSALLPFLPSGEFQEDEESKANLLLLKGKLP
jgi:hypothetical protein